MVLLRACWAPSVMLKRHVRGTHANHQSSRAGSLNPAAHTLSLALSSTWQCPGVTPGVIEGPEPQHAEPVEEATSGSRAAMCS